MTFSEFCELVGVNPKHYVYSMVNGREEHTPKVVRKVSPIEDHDWCEKQKPFPHSLVMPRLLTNFCADCKQYVLQNHEHAEANSK